MRDVESVEVVVDSPPAVSQVQDNRCAAGNLCGTKTTPLTIGGCVCLNCHKKYMGVSVGNCGLKEEMVVELHWRT